MARTANSSELWPARTMTGISASAFFMRCKSCRASHWGRRSRGWPRQDGTSQTVVVHRDCSRLRRRCGLARPRKLQIPERMTGSESMTRILFLLKHSPACRRRIGARGSGSYKLEGSVLQLGSTLRCYRSSCGRLLRLAKIKSPSQTAASQTAMLCPNFVSGCDGGHTCKGHTQKKRTCLAGPLEVQQLGDRALTLTGHVRNVAMRNSVFDGQRGLSAI